MIIFKNDLHIGLNRVTVYYSKSKIIKAVYSNDQTWLSDSEVDGIKDIYWEDLLLAARRDLGECNGI